MTHYYFFDNYVSEKVKSLQSLHAAGCYQKKFYLYFLATVVLAECRFFRCLWWSSVGLSINW